MGLVDSFFPILADFDDRIDELEDAIFVRADDEQLHQIFAMKRLPVGMRKAVTPQRDTFARLVGGAVQLPGFTDEDERYFRDVYDHMIRISDLVDSYRDLLTSAMDVYLSSVSNRLNVVMKQLAVVATIFLPLSFVVGFFGQNFGWMVAHITGPGTFLALGIGTEIAVLLIFLIMFQTQRMVISPVLNRSSEFVLGGHPLRGEHSPAPAVPVESSAPSTVILVEGAALSSGLAPRSTASAARRGSCG